MVANHVSILNNVVKKNNSLNSLGVYTYDVEKVDFSNNALNENTVAMSIENTRNMVIKNNSFSANGTVIQAKRSGSLSIQDNEFYGNILSVRTDNEGVKLHHNYYDDYTGKDYDGDGIGDTHYIATNSFCSLIKNFTTIKIKFCNPINDGFIHFRICHHCNKCILHSKSRA